MCVCARLCLCVSILVGIIIITSYFCVVFLCSISTTKLKSLSTFETIYI